MKRTDFIYKDELAKMQSDGILNRLDLAFSRDQAEKIYVQTRMQEHAKDLYAALEEGGHFYVCGDASRMAKDVDRALHKVISEQRWSQLRRCHGLCQPDEKGKAIRSRRLLIRSRITNKKASLQSWLFYCAPCSCTILTA